MIIIVVSTIPRKMGVSGFLKKNITGDEFV